MRNLIIGILIAAPFSTLTANAACKLPSGTYVGSGMINDLYSTSSNNEYVAITASVTISSSTVTFRGYMKDLKTQEAKYKVIGTGTFTSWDSTYCIGLVTMAPTTTTNIVAVSSSDSGNTISFSDFTASTGKLKQFDLILKKI